MIKEKEMSDIKLLKLDFSGRINRMEFLKGNLAMLGLIFVGAALISLAGMNTPNVELELLNWYGYLKVALSAVLVLVAVVGYLYLLPLALSLVTRRFRDMGMEDTGTIVAAVIAYLIAQTVFGLFILIPLLWKGKQADVSH